MKYILGFFVILFFISCDNELDLVADFKEVPIVYGLIDRTDTAQYVRVERAFADRAVSANEIAQNPDSLYYDDITVKLINKRTGSEFILQRVDGNLEGYPREDGVFATSPNYLYKVKTVNFPLAIGDSISLEIGGVFEDRLVTSITDIFKKPFFVTPSNLKFERGKLFSLSWNSDIPTVYSAAFIFNITEISANVSKDTVLRWEVLNNSNRLMLEVEGESFYSFLKGALTANSNVTRFMNSAEFELVSGNASVSDYIRVGQANLGITSSGEIPSFSNLSEGLGIFGSKAVDRRTGIPFRDSTLDSLRGSVITKDLNFQ
ncbi:MAG: hypothetical protein ACI9P5_003049 [Saprospiraceae bacterium]|jgi:hypothetical protein|tara:strand:+ start:612 stop:1565 length:954 start_codon:yes stop_codon:yes gene_type:complete